MQRHKDHTRLAAPRSEPRVSADRQVSWLKVSSLCTQMIRNKEIPRALPASAEALFEQAPSLFLRLSLDYSKLAQVRVFISSIKTFLPEAFVQKIKAQTSE